jgi:predicted nucleic acid-binding protein
VSVRTLVDTGPFVAVLCDTDSFHSWAKQSFARVGGPVYTSEPVLTETMFLLARNGIDPLLALNAVLRGAVSIDFSLRDEAWAIHKLMTRYADVPAKLADISLVRMSELHPHCHILTMDRDFLIYRRNGRDKIPLIAPFES